MKNRMIAGFTASIMAILIPLLGGMAQGLQMAEVTSEPELSYALEEAETGDTERTVQAIVIHENVSTLLDEATTVQVEVGGEIQEMTLQAYLVGVLMGEMPASFELEALKAQAIAARTYTLRQLEGGGVLSDDPAVCQAFLPVDDAEEKWGELWEEYLAKLQQAVVETDGQVLTYDGALISATYFSCSGGKTESAQAVWGGDVPYLLSVESPGEEEYSAYASTVTVTMEEFLEALGVSKVSVSAVTYTDGGGVATITVDGKTFTGTQMRSLFGLHSTLFTMAIGQDAVTFSVQGYGHRVGLSQCGAQAMAEAGCSCDEILKWYYTGVEIETYEGV